jgi:hypothetical protein
MQENDKAKCLIETHNPKLLACKLFESGRVLKEETVCRYIPYSLFLISIQLWNLLFGKKPINKTPKKNPNKPRIAVDDRKH